MPDKVTIYHKKDGAAEMFAIDANHALRKHPAEWSQEPWSKAAAPTGVDEGDLTKLTVKQLLEVAAAEGVAVESDDNKAGLVEKITAARAAKV